MFLPTHVFAFMSANRHRGMWLARWVVATASDGLTRGMCGGPRRCDGDGQRQSSSTLALSFHHTVVHYQHGSRLAAVHSRRATPSPSQPAAPQCSARTKGTQGGRLVTNRARSKASSSSAASSRPSAPRGRIRQKKEGGDARTRCHIRMDTREPGYKLLI